MQHDVLPVTSETAENSLLECLHSLFEARADAHPEAPAVICPLDHGEVVVSYGELERRANRLARYLITLGAGPGKFVGLYCERGIEPIVAILGCLKAGAAYVPLDPSFPEERIRHILQETEAELLLTDSSLFDKASSAFTSGTVIPVDAAWETIARHSAQRISPIESGVCPSDACYVIYTSGTTGRPKGVVTEHLNAMLFVKAFNEACGTSPSDRIYQGFSLSFDGSVEEIWMALSNGSALVVGKKDTPRFGNELGHFLTRSGITYFSTVPTLLSTLTEPIAGLRLLVVSGEMCPPDLVNRWAKPGVRMLNVYGPTEATVNTTVAECLPGRPVTIGRPLRGYGIHILDSEMRPVPTGDKGELFIGGKTLARGYFKRPDLTAEKFLQDPGIKTRLYRTGDLVRLNAEGELEFFGRIDSQVKIRGYRVELGEIEALLLENEGVSTASVKLVDRDGLQTIAAYVTLDSPGAQLDRGAVLSMLETRLPPYMIPGYLDVLEELPRLTSGKVDRSRLPAPACALVREVAMIVEPEGELEAAIARIWSKIFGVSRVSVEDDFFLDLGGHSLLAARMITSVRAETHKRVTVRDAYDHPTIRKLATHLSMPSEPEAEEAAKAGEKLGPSSREVYESLPLSTRLATFIAQSASIYLIAGIASIPFGLLFLAGVNWLEGTLSLYRLVALGFAIPLLAWPVFLAMSIGSKWLIIGRYKPGRYPLWGSYFFRWWLVNRLQAFSGAGLLTGTPLLPIYFRLMGAKVGRGCTLDTAQCSIWDLVSIGDETSIGADTQFLGYRIEDGMLVLGRVEIGSRCFIGLHSALGLDVRMGNDARLDDQSLLPDRGVIGEGVSMRGSPAQAATVPVPQPSVPQSANTEVRRNSALYGFAHLALAELMAVILILPTIPFLIGWYRAFADYGVMAGSLSLIVSVPLGVVTACLYLVVLKRTIMNHAAPGEYAVESAFYLRKWIADGLIRLGRASLLPVYTTLYLPPWMRLMGAKIGARAEISTLWYFSPDLIDIGEESFFADGSIIGGKRFFRGRFAIGLNRIGRRSFVGNSAILPVGTGLGNGCLLGVQSIPPSSAPGASTPDGTEWLGSPAFALPNRPKVGNFTNEVTFRPSLKLYVQRAIIDGLRILIPGYIGLATVVAGTLALYFIRRDLGTNALFALMPAVGVALSLGCILFVAALKKTVMGTFKPVIKPLWSMYVWLNEMVNGAYESVMAPAMLPFLGTPFAAPLLRLIGCRIGCRTYIETTLFSEFDLVQIGDYAALSAGAVIQNHLFEDRVFKSSYLKIGPECSVGNMAVILYDSEMQDGASIGPLSLLMKGETLSPRTSWHGIPTVQVREASRQSPLLKEPFELHDLAPRGLRRESAAPQAKPETVTEPVREEAQI